MEIDFNLKIIIDNDIETSIYVEEERLKKLSLQIYWEIKNES
jgi:hypothetical protein